MTRRFKHLCAVMSLAAGAGTVGAVTGTSTAVAAPHQVTLTGRVEVTVANGGMLNDREFMTLRSHGRRYGLRLPGNELLPSRTKISVTGTISHGTFIASSMHPLALAPTIVTTGTQSVYVIRVSWSGNVADATTAANVTTAFNSVSSWFNEVSYGQLPGLTVSQDSTYESIAAPADCSTSSGGGVDTIYNEAVAAAHASDNSFNDANYDHVVIYFANSGNPCLFAGLAEVGGSKVWVNGELDTRVLTHELGHNLGLSHSHSQECHDGTNTAVTISTTCDSPSEYGDPGDSMGGNGEGSGAAGHYNAAQKDKLGWLPAADTAPCTNLTLQPYEGSPTAGTLSARIDAGADPVSGSPTSYWLEYRHPATGTVDDGLGAGVPLGVLLHRTDSIPGNPPNVGPDLLDGQPGTPGDFSDAEIPAPTGTVSTPEGYSFNVTDTSATASIGLNTTMPSVPRQVSASAGSAGVNVSWSAPTCLAGAGSVSGYHVGVFGSAAVSTTSTHATVTGLAGNTENEFVVSATAGGHTSPLAVAPMSAPVITGADIYSNGFGLHFTRSVSNGGRQIAFYLAHAVPVGGGEELQGFFDNTTNPTVDVIATDPSSPPPAGTKWDVWITPLMDDFSEGPPSQHLTMTIDDNAPPAAHITAPAAAWTLGTGTTVKWTGSDPGGAGIKSYDVRYRRASYNGSLGGYVYPATWQATTHTSASLSVSQGTTYCFSVRARDNNLNLSGWSPQRCTAVPLDDRSLTASSGWSRGTGTAYYAHTISSSTHVGAKLTRTSVRAHHLVLVVTRCAGCGSVAVYAGSKKLATVNLAATSTHNQVVVVIPTSALSGVTITVKILSSGKAVKIDALGVSAT